MSALQDAIYDLTSTEQKEICQNELDALQAELARKDAVIAAAKELVIRWHDVSAGAWEDGDNGFALGLETAEGELAAALREGAG